MLRGKNGGSERVEEDEGFPSEARSLRRYAADIRSDERLQRADAAATLEAQLAAAALVEYKPKASPNMQARRLFSDDDLLFFERTLIKYGELGWPMDIKAIQRLFSKHAKETGRSDWKSGDPYVVCETYVRDFVKSRPALMAFKASNIDPLRSKKATATVGACQTFACVCGVPRGRCGLRSCVCAVCLCELCVCREACGCCSFTYIHI